MTSRPDLVPSPGSAAAVASAPVSDALVGKRVDKYEIVRVIGRGGMGTVYEALNTTIGKRVAMKFVDAEMAQSKDSVARFQREAEAASAVESAHIVEIFDSGVGDDGIPYIVMELLRGEDLGHRIKRCGRLEINEAVHIVAQILRGLHRAHEAGIVHRDLKPDNIFLVDRDDDQSFAKILDFGISKVQRQGGVPVHTLTRQGTVLGTPFYMSPEQAQALPDIDGRTDLWSVGAILYECLTGRPPYSGTSYEQVIVNICMRDAEDVRAHNPAVPEAIAHVIAKALARDRRERFAAAREVLEALKAATGGVISARSGAIPAEPRDSVSSSSPDFRLTPPGAGVASQGSTPESRSDASPIEVRLGGSSKVGWSTSRRAARREKRTFAMIAVSALLAGSLGAFLFVRSRPQATPTPPPLHDDEISVQLQANVSGARFLVDGVPAQSGVLKGQKGDVKRVRVEAQGYVPSELEVTLAASAEPVNIVLAPATTVTTAALPVVSPGAPAASAKMADPVKKPRDQGKTGANASPHPTVTPGVGGGQLKLKTD
jgi:eukaryotic-like serine/threonine-protein kinase